MVETSNSFHGAAQDLFIWLRDELDLQARLVPTGQLPSDEQVSVFALGLDTPSKDRSGPKPILSAIAHFSVCFGPDTVVRNLDLFDKLYFRTLSSTAFSHSNWVVPDQFWLSPPGLFLNLARRIERSIDAPDPDLIKEPLIIDFVKRTSAESV